MEVGVFSPYVRNHKEFFATANEPWSYGEEAEAISKAYIGFRYRLMPYIYSKFYEASQSGLPVARSLCINYPFDDKVYDNTYQYQFLFGDALMVVPATTDEKNKKIYLPGGEWYDLFTDEKISGSKELDREIPIYEIPLFIKASSVIPMQTLVQSTKDKSSDTLFIHVYNGTEKNNFIFYEDAGDGFEYVKGVYSKRNIEFNPIKKQILISKREGSFISPFKKIQIILHGFSIGLKNVLVNGVSQNVFKSNIKLLDPLETLKDYYDKDYFQSLKQKETGLQESAAVIDYSRDELNISW